MNNNNDYYNYAIRHMEILSSVMRQLDSLNQNMAFAMRHSEQSVGQRTNTVPVTTTYRSRNRTNYPYTARRNNFNNLNNLNNNAVTQTRRSESPLNTLATNILNSLFWDPVAIFPTEEEINDATTTIAYSDLPDDAARCPITLEEFNNESEILRIDRCGHCFSRSGILRWFRNHVSCPVCRHDIRNNNDEETAPTTENNESNLSEFQFDFTLNPNDITNSIFNFPVLQNVRTRPNNPSSRGNPGNPSSS
jgi:hypothetical protein